MNKRIAPCSRPTKAPDHTRWKRFICGMDVNWDSRNTKFLCNGHSCVIDTSKAIGSTYSIYRISGPSLPRNALPQRPCSPAAACRVLTEPQVIRVNLLDAAVVYEYWGVACEDMVRVGGVDGEVVDGGVGCPCPYRGDLYPGAR